MEGKGVCNSMKTKLQKSVVTNRKVSFIEITGINETRHPVMLRMSKEEWLERDQPETITVEVT